MDRSNLVFLDTETTGRGPQDRLCQVAYKFQGKEREGLFRPPIPISIEAMAVTHITNRMTATAEPFSGSMMQGELRDVFSQGNILVAHNAAFDAEMLEKEGIKAEKMVDTLKLAHYLDKKAEIPRHSLQYLRYYFDLDVDIVQAPPHSALGDVRVLEKLFEYLFAKMLQEDSQESAILEKMIAISARPLEIKKFNFGKYDGMSVGEVALRDPGYLRWLWEQKTKARDNGEGNDENWIYTLERFIKTQSGKL